MGETETSVFGVEKPLRTGEMETDRRFMAGPSSPARVGGVVDSSGVIDDDLVVVVLPFVVPPGPCNCHAVPNEGG